MPLYCENQSAIRLAENPVFHARTKHVDVHYHFLREKVLQEELEMHKVKSKDQCPVWSSSFILCFLVDYLQERAKGSLLYGFRGGPAGIMKGKYVELTPEYIYPYRNQGSFDMICSGRDKIETPEQFQQAADTAAKLDLDGLLVIGEDDSNTNACLLAENFRYITNFFLSRKILLGRWNCCLYLSSYVIHVIHGSIYFLGACISVWDPSK
ncbi:pyrophosphate--fructose 6-phosphate 1-phosphotransferase subunit beta 2-like [Humulus lupulus]|uniref:pyrophosphate--fructose 6-phosphate 1-phosphotransferase subunit beta 2-like n=1 Tax=Humulus lupulus TaxID=3486 RepID=UPI002B40BF50|nr:pyrophosphate--fructose 6-phosphate 1-phosphotransferase subunit beta 2-like [Humulus lupulus]